MESRDDTINLWEVGRTLRREARWVIGGVVLGLALGALSLIIFRPQYEGRASVLLRTQTDRASTAALGAVLGDVAGIGDLLPGGIGASGIETELEILRSRAILGSVVDSLHLQARVLSPTDVPTIALFSRTDFDPRLTEGVYEFERAGDGYRVVGGAVQGAARPGDSVTLPGAVLTLRSGDLPESFRIQLMRREAAIDGLEERLIADQAAGDIATLVYTGDDPVTAAAVPNTIYEHFQYRKRTTDRGVNQRRYEFLEAREDSVSIELALVEDQLREHQERTGMIDPELVGEAELEGAMLLRASLEEISVQVSALQNLVDGAGTGAAGARQLAGFPAFLESPAVNDLVSQISQQETRLAQLRERRTEQDPEVIGVRNSIEQLEAQLASLVSSFLAGLRGQEAELERELSRYRDQLTTLPAQAQTSLVLTRDLTRLAQTQLALQMQMLETRLAAMGEGGEIRQIDVAVAPDEPSFPQPIPMLGIGLFGGLLLGIVTALGRAHVRGRVWDAGEAELAAGIPTVMLGERTPLLLGGLDTCRTVLVLPVGRSANGDTAAVARRIASTAAGQGRSVTLVTLDEVSTAELPVGTGVASTGTKVPALVPAGRAESSEYLVYRIYPSRENGWREVRPALEEMEQDPTLVVVSLPSLDHPDAAALLSPKRRVVLSGRAGEIQRQELQELVANLRRLEIPVSGLVLSTPGRNGDSHT